MIKVTIKGARLGYSGPLRDYCVLFHFSTGDINFADLITTKKVSLLKPGTKTSPNLIKKQTPRFSQRTATLCDTIERHQIRFNLQLLNYLR